MRRYLIGLFVLIFFISGALLGFLVADERQDLSTRAAGGVVENKEKTNMEGEVVFGWESVVLENLLGSGRSVRVGYPAGSFVQSDRVFTNQDQKITVRITGSADRDGLMRQVFSEDYKLKMSLGTIAGGDGISGTASEYTFFGESVIVTWWEVTLEGGRKIYALSTVPSTDKNIMVADLLANIEEEKAEKVLGATDTISDSARVMALVRPSVLMLVTTMCGKAKVGVVPGSVNFANREYPFCIGGSGSGFFITEEGHIATNGHVVKFVPEIALAGGVKTGALKDLLVDLLGELVLQETGVEVPKEMVSAKIEEFYRQPESVMQMIMMVETLRQKGLISLDSADYKFFAQLGSTPVKIDKNWKVNEGEDIVTASLVAVDYESVDINQGFNSSDVAILKLATPGKYPALELGSIEDANVGSAIQVVGYPGVASGTDENYLLDASATTEPTVTRGIVSAIKNAKGDKKKLIQTDASITHGNSGGPAVNENGIVIGVATYGLFDEEGGGNYNFLRDIGDLRALMAANRVEQNGLASVYKDWKFGLESYWLSYFGFAKGDFERVKKAYPMHPTVDSYLTKAEDKVGTAEDKTPKFTRAQRRALMGLSGGAMGLSIFGAAGLGIWEVVDKRRGGFGGMTRRTPLTAGM